jgi:hypothetical protein
VTQILLSLDIDGTLAAGDPPGPITFDMVATAQSRGHIIGSASDRSLSEQRAIWKSAGIVVDFVCNKHQLANATAAFSCSRRLHIGDTTNDEYFAGLAGFKFRYVTEVPASWLEFMEQYELDWDSAVK